MRVQRLILAVILLACSVTACAVDVTGTAHPPPPLAFVRYINAVSDTFNLDFRAVDQVSYSQPFLNVAFRGLGGGNYQGYQAGKRHIRVFLDPNPSDPTVGVNPAIVSTFLVDTNFTFTAGTYYTIVHVGGSRAGSAVPDKFWIITDALPAQTAGNIGFRIVNAAPVLSAANAGVDVHVGATAALALAAPPTASALAFGAINPYVSQATGATVMVLTVPGTATVIGAAAGYTVQAGTAGTTAADPIYGSGVGGSIFTAFIFDASAAGTVGAVFATPGIVYWPDLQPPRTTTDMLVPATRVANP
jgi:hypothetical protein